MSSFGCENNSLEICIESTPPPTIKTKVKTEIIASVVHSAENFIQRTNIKNDGNLIVQNIPYRYRYKVELYSYTGFFDIENII